jgi:aminopeptidase YwaD
MIHLRSLFSLLVDPESGERAWRNAAAIQDLDRWSSFSMYAESSALCAELFRRLGLEPERVAFPADGVTKFGDWMMPLAWDASSAGLEVVGGRPLASYAEVPQSLVMWSAPTSRGGIESDLLVLREGTAAELGGLDARGKVLFTPGHPTELKPAAAKAGAVGILSDWTKARGLPDVHQWINTGSDTPGGWAMHAHDSRLWGFTLTKREGQRLREEAEASVAPLRLRASVDSRLYAGELHWVSALIPGETDEEVLLLAHINEQGGNDNAAGASAVVEAARLLSGLIERGVLARPERGIRCLLMPESYGTMAYVVQQRERLARTTMALNVDSGAGDYDHEDSVADLYPNPHCCPNYADALMVGLVKAFYEARGRPDKWRLNPYMLAGDNFLGEPLIGVPNPWIWMGDGGDFWHNTGDTPERVDPRSLSDLVRMVAAFAYLAASGTEAELRALAEATRAELPEETRRLLRLPDDPMPVVARGDTGARRVPKRSLPGALTLDGVPFERWGPVGSSPRWWGPQLAAWWWADGNRSIGEIEARLMLEFGRAPEGVEGFFEWLAGIGYVELAG